MSLPGGIAPEIFVVYIQLFLRGGVIPTMTTERPVKILRDTIIKGTIEQGHLPMYAFLDESLWDHLVKLLPDQTFITAQARGFFFYRKVRVYALRNITHQVCSVTARWPFPVTQRLY